jgi:integrase
MTMRRMGDELCSGPKGIFIRTNRLRVGVFGGRPLRRYCASALATAVISPVRPREQRPHRALHWNDVQCLLRSVDTSTAHGLRDRALLLLMSTYGLGAGEVIRLQLQDIDWNGAG